MIHRNTTAILTTLMLSIGCIDMRGQESWAKTLGGTEQELGYSISTTSNDEAVVTGSTYSKKASNIWISKHEKGGRLVWKKTYGGTAREVGNSVATTSDGTILVTGYTDSNDGDFEKMNKGERDIFVIKLDKNGEVQWKKLFGGTGWDSGESISVTADGEIFVAGSTASNNGDFEGMNKGGKDIFIVKLDKDGSLLWKKTFGGTDTDDASSVTITPDGDVLISGSTSSKDGDFEGRSRSKGHIYVIKLDRHGGCLWKKAFGGTGVELGKSITSTSDGEIFVTGYTNSNDGDFEGVNKGDSDIFVIKLDKDGKILWKKTFGGIGDDQCNSIISMSDGSIVMSGHTSSKEGDFEGMNKGKRDIFVIKLDKNGKPLWKKTFGGTEHDMGTSMTTTLDRGILLTGGTSSNDGDFKGLDNSGIMIKLDSHGNLNP